MKEAAGEVCVGLWGGELGRHEAVVVDSAGASAGSRSAGAAAEVDVQSPNNAPVPGCHHYSLLTLPIFFFY